MPKLGSATYCQIFIMIQKGYILTNIKRARPKKSDFANFCQLKLRFWVKTAELEVFDNCI